MILAHIKYQKMNRSPLYLLVFLFAFVLSTTACKKDDPVIPNEEELITTFTYTLSTSGATPVVLSFTDLDGDGGNAPTINGGTLQANTTYTGTIDLLNEAESPAESITAEIAEEKEDHQFFFATDGLDLSFAYEDLDANGQPVGLTTTLVTGNAGTGNLRITLRHQPDKSANGVTNGAIDNAGGETDIEVTFPVTIQ